MHNPLFKPSTSCHLETLSSITAIHLIKTMTFDSCLQLFSPIFHTCLTLSSPFPWVRTPQGKPLPSKLERKSGWIQWFVNCQSRNLQKTQYWGRKAWTVIDELLEAHYGQVGANKGAHTLLWILPLGTLPNCPSKYQGGNALMLSAGGEGKESFWNMPQ